MPVPAALRPDAGHGGVAPVVDADLAPLHGLRRVHEPAHLLVGQQPLLDPLGIHGGLRAEHAHDQLLLAHLQGEIDHGAVVVEGGVLGDVQGEGGLAHGGPGGYDDQIGLLQAVGHAVQVPKARGDAGELSLPGHQIPDLVEGVGHDVPDGGDGVFGLAHGDVVDPLLRQVQALVHVLVVVHTIPDHLVAGMDQTPLDAALLHDLGVVAHVGRRGHEGHELGEVHRAADHVQKAPALQLLAEGDQVHGLARSADVGHGLEDPLMGGAVEVLHAELFQHQFQGVLFEEHAPQHGFLRVQIVGQYPFQSFFHFISVPRR